ncbi:MAG: nucleotide exchange factor GrpE [Actinomycetota bacterium]|nr:nucleotide exchange factor GrpE [Actinomycetota bacterium]
MTEEQPRPPIKVKVHDKRGGGTAGPEDPAGPVLLEETSEQEQIPLGEIDQQAPAEPELTISELQRMKADLENARKRMVKEQTRITEHATRRLVERLLPALDHFQLALDHGEGGKGIELAVRQVQDVLAGEGLEEIDVPEGSEFDPRLHHAVATYHDPAVSVDTVTKVQRRGYRFKGQTLRSPEVVVAQPIPKREEA